MLADLRTEGRHLTINVLRAMEYPSNVVIKIFAKKLGIAFPQCYEISHLL